ncbi:hypothetical protein GLOIN_2v1842417 [Rhizophagus irregularis DAOM 181602=DAOM 197198]|nr:hypothetical protein GLOIN_2v1842417 [Rhizophagus irregularis DAOM 181602=DAOM 197198]
MSNIGDLGRINPNNAEDFLKFILYNGYQYLHEVTAELGLFVENDSEFERFTLRSSREINLLPAPILYMVIWVITQNRNVTLPMMNCLHLLAHLETPPILPDVEMTLSIKLIPETSQKKGEEFTRTRGHSNTKKLMTSESRRINVMGHTIKLSVKRQHKYQTLRVKIGLNSFTLPQFNKFWMTDLGGIPVRWFPASWTLRERKQREKFQAVIHDIPEE